MLRDCGVEGCPDPEDCCEIILQLLVNALASEPVQLVKQEAQSAMVEQVVDVLSARLGNSVPEVCVCVCVCVYARARVCVCVCVNWARSQNSNKLDVLCARRAHNAVDAYVAHAQ